MVCIKYNVDFMQRRLDKCKFIQWINWSNIDFFLSKHTFS